MAQPSPSPIPQQQVNGDRPEPAAMDATSASPEGGAAAAQTASDPTNTHIPVKRKRDDEGEEKERSSAEKTGADATADADMMDIDEDKSCLKDIKDPQSLIRNVFDTLSSLDPTSSIFQRPLRHAESDDEPDAKRQKSNGPGAPSISNKVEQGRYSVLNDLAIDFVSSVQDMVDELTRATSDDKPNKEQTIIDLTLFRAKALDVFRREMHYPQIGFEQTLAKGEEAKRQSKSALSIAPTPGGRTLFSSAAKREFIDEEGIQQSISEAALPSRVSVTHLLPANLPQQDQDPTIGELFAPPKPLPPLQPPKHARAHVKGNVVSFYKPELTEKMKYRTNSFFSQRLSVGHFLDYGSVMPKSDKKKERRESLAGRRPSSSAGSEVAEMESLFRGAFSSFAPTKDDSSAVVPARTAARIYWQNAGYRQFDRMIAAEVDGGEVVEEEEVLDFDDDEIEGLIEKETKVFDPDMVDPALSSVFEDKKSDEDKEADMLLDEVSDLIETLASYQRIRNGSMPTNQNRHSGDPASSDLLRNGQPATPTDEETGTYNMLKDQLSLIIKTLPPHAVAKLDGDQLKDLLVSTKLEVRSDTYHGVMGDVGLPPPRQQQPAPATAPRPSNHRAGSSASFSTQYTTSQFGTPSRQPVPAQNQFYRPTQTPMQPHAQNLPRQGAPNTMPQQYRPQQPQPPRPANGYAQGGQHYAAQLAKTQTPFGHQQMPQYPQQQRQYSYGNMSQQNTPTARYTSGYGQSYQHQSQQQPGTPTPSTFGGYPNGAPGMQQRTMSPQVPGAQYGQSPQMQQQQPMQTQQHMQYQQQRPPQQQQQFQQYPQQVQYQQQHPQHQQQQQQQQQRPYQNMQQGSPMNRPQYPNGVPQPQPVGGYGQNMGGQFAGGQDPSRSMEQARARAAAQQTSAQFTDKISQGGNPGMNFNQAQYAANQARLGGGAKSQSPANNSPRPIPPPPGSNHSNSPRPMSAAAVSSAAVGQNGAPPARKVTPVPVPGIPGAPPQNVQQQQQGQGQGQGSA